MDNKDIFLVLKNCYINLEKYKRSLPGDQRQLQQAIDSIQVGILEVLSSGKELLDQNQSLDIEFWNKIEEKFKDSDIFSNSDKLSKMIEVVKKIQEFAYSTDPTYAQKAKNFLTSALRITVGWGDVEDEATISNVLEDELKKLQVYKETLAKHGEIITDLKEKNIVPVVPPLLENLPETDASRLVTMAVFPHVEECMKQNFAYLFEYACCIHELIVKVHIDNESTGVLKAALEQILNELNITVDDLMASNANHVRYQDKQKEFVALKIPKDDCLNITKLYEHQSHMRKNMNRMFEALNKHGLQNNVLVASFKNSYDACEKNQDSTKYVLENLRFVRGCAKRIKQEFDQPLLKIKGYNLITLQQLLPALGIPAFIAKNIQALNYKEQSDLMRVRMLLEANKVSLQDKNTYVQKLKTFVLRVDLGISDVSMQRMRAAQTAHLTKYSILCAQQLQLATILLEQLQDNEPKLQKNLKQLRAIYEKITAGLKYNHEQHRELHEALNALCTDFYPEIDPKSMQLLISAGNIQNKFDCQVSSNDLGQALISNSALYSYTDSSESGAFTNFMNDQLSKVVSSLNADSFGASDTVTNNLLGIAKSKVGFSDDIEELNNFAHSLYNSEIVDGDKRERDEKVFMITSQQQASSFINKILNFMINVFAYISAVLATASPQLKKKISKTSTDEPDGRKSKVIVSKYKLHKSLIKVQLEQHVAVLEKSLQLASAMKIKELEAPIAEIYKQRFGLQNGDDSQGLDEMAKTYFKIQALQMAILTIADPTVRQQLADQLQVTMPLSDMTLADRKKFIKHATNLLAKYSDQIKIDAFFKQTKEAFESKISKEISKKKLSAHGLAAEQTINWLLSAPLVMEATKSLFMISPILNGIVKKSKQHFANIYRTAVLFKYVQDALYVMSGKTLEINKILKIPNSPKQAARFYIYEHGKLGLDFECADKLIGILQANKSEMPSKEVNVGQMSFAGNNLRMFKNMAHGKPSNNVYNPYDRNTSSVVKSTQEDSARQVVDVLNITLKFIDNLENKVDLDKEASELKKILEELCSDKAKNDDEVRNVLMNNALSALSALTHEYQLQNDVHCFEFMMLLRYSVESISTIANAAIQLEEYMSYHGVSYSDKEENTILKQLIASADKSIKGKFFKKPAEIFSGGSVHTLQKALELMPANVRYASNAELQTQLNGKHSSLTASY